MASNAENVSIWWRHHEWMTDLSLGKMWRNKKHQLNTPKGWEISRDFDGYIGWRHWSVNMSRSMGCFSCIRSLIKALTFSLSYWFVQNSANIESFKRNYKMYKLLINSWLIQWNQFCAFLRFVRFCVMKWLFLTFRVVRSVHWCGWIFVSHIAYTILDYVSVSNNLVWRF